MTVLWKDEYASVEATVANDSAKHRSRTAVRRIEKGKSVEAQW